MTSIDNNLSQIPDIDNNKIEDTIKWMRERFQKFENEEVDLDQFIESKFSQIPISIIYN